LLATHHPISKEEMKDSSPSEDTDCILGHLVIKGGWELHEVGNQESFKSVQIEVSEGSNREENRKTYSIHHSDKGNIHDT
jgi:hypothetical protein